MASLGWNVDDPAPADAWAIGAGGEVLALSE